MVVGGVTWYLVTKFWFSKQETEDLVLPCHQLSVQLRRSSPPTLGLGSSHAQRNGLKLRRSPWLLLALKSSDFSSSRLSAGSGVPAAAVPCKLELARARSPACTALPAGNRAQVFHLGKDRCKPMSDNILIIHCPGTSKTKYKKAFSKNSSLIRKTALHLIRNTPSGLTRTVTETQPWEHTSLTLREPWATESRVCEFAEQNYSKHFHWL